jgi:hypothetical protein
MQQPADDASGASDIPRFVEVAEAAGITDRSNGRGIAVADFDADGDLDLYIANQGAAACYYVNTRLPGRTDTAANRASGTAATPGAATLGEAAFLRLQLRGQPQHPRSVHGRQFASSTFAVGARVTVIAANGRQMREVQGGMGFASQSEYTLHFGIADPQAVEAVEVQWPSGRRQHFTVDAARRFLNTTTTLLEPVEAESDVTQTN